VSKPEFPFLKNEEETKLLAIFVTSLFCSGVRFDVEDNKEYWVVTLVGF
jgi:hypothetical protein